jgi:cysteine-rich repeat protein
MKSFVIGCLIAGAAACTSTSNPPPGPICGNGVVETGEACDDGSRNGTAGDACSATCTVVTAQQAHISATWHLDSVNATTGALTQAPCPNSTDAAALHTVAANADGTAVSACTTAGSNCFIDVFNCTDFAGVSAALPPGNYLTWVTITDSTGANVYATSTAEFVDVTNVDKNFDTHILVDGGYFLVRWTLVGSTSGNTLTCAQTTAASSAGGSVETTATIMGTSTAFSDKFNCEDHFGYSAPLPADTYVVVLDALNSSDAAISDPNSTTATIGATPNTIFDLGVIPISITGM